MGEWVGGCERNVVCMSRIASRFCAPVLRKCAAGRVVMAHHFLFVLFFFFPLPCTRSEERGLTIPAAAGVVHGGLKNWDLTCHLMYEKGTCGWEVIRRGSFLFFCFFRRYVCLSRFGRSDARPVNNLAGEGEQTVMGIFKLATWYLLGRLVGRFTPIRVRWDAHTHTRTTWAKCSIVLEGIVLEGGPRRVQSRTWACVQPIQNACCAARPGRETRWRGGVCGVCLMPGENS